LEHITREANMALGGCGPGNILREIAKKADRKELDQVRKELEQAQTDNAHLHLQMASMAEELGQKIEEVRKYHAEQAMVFTQIRELIGHPGEITNKAQLYDQLVEAGDPTFAKQTIPILVKYSRRMNDLFAEIQKVIPRQVLYPGPPGSPIGTLYEVMGEVAFVQDLPAAAEPSQQGGGSGPGSSGRDPERTHSSGARRKITGPAMTSSVRYGREQSPAPKTTDRSRTLDRARTPIRHQTPDREASRDKGKTHALSTTPTFPADHPMPEPLSTPPSRTPSAREPRVSSGGRHSEQPAGKSPTPSPGYPKEYRFRNTRFPDAASGGNRRLRG
jgi:hypothetical protein